MGLPTRSASPWFALFVLTGITTVGFIDRIIVNVLVEPLKAEFGLSDTQIGLLTGVAFAALNVGLGIFVARLAERHRRLSLTAVGVLAWSVATAACGVAGNWIQLLFARIGVGVGEAVGLPANQSVIADYFPPEKRATAMSVQMLAPPIGALLGAAGGAYIANTYGWQMAFYVAAAPGVVFALLVYFFVAEPPRGQHDTGDVETVPPFSAVLARFWRLPSARHMVAGSALASMIGFGLNAFVAALLMRKFGLSLVQAGLFSGLLASAPGVISITMGGMLADHFGKQRPSTYALLPGISLLLAVPIYLFAISRDDVAILLTCMALAALFQYSYLGCTYGTLQNMMHARSRATASALLNAIYTLMGGLGPLLIGLISDRFQLGGSDGGNALAWAMGLTALIYLWAVVHYLLAARHVSQDLATARTG